MLSGGRLLTMSRKVRSILALAGMMDTSSESDDMTAFVVLFRIQYDRCNLAKARIIDRREVHAFGFRRV